MLKRIREMLRDRRGFTLIELMVVVVIIGILAAIAIPQFTGQANKAKQSKVKADLKTIGTALEMYYTENNNNAPSGLSALVSGGYIRSIPKDPWGNDYGYSSSPIGDGSGTPFTLYSTNNNGTRLSYPRDL